MKIKVLESAQLDLVNGFHFYDRQTEGLGNYFVDSIYSDIESLYLYAGIHSQHFGYYRLLSKNFPFAIYYRIKGNNVLIYAVLDCRQNPAWTRNRLQ